MTGPLARVGFIGLGNMGGRMSVRLREAGYAVRGYDVRAGRAADLGLEPAATVAEACDADCVCLSLPDSAVIEEVVLGPGPGGQGVGGPGGQGVGWWEPDRWESGCVLDAARPGLVVVDLSTADPASSRAIHARLAERGVDFLDAGVSGGPRAAEAGTLTIMVGGGEPALERMRPVLEALGTRIHHLGGPGAGHVAKAINNFLNGVNLAAAAEAMVVAVKAGLDPALLLEVVNASSGRNWATEFRFPRIVEGDYQEGGLTNRLMLKDLDVYLGLVRSTEAPTRLAEPCRAVFSLAVEHGYGDRVSNTVVDVLGDLAGGVRVRRAAPGGGAPSAPHRGN